MIEHLKDKKIDLYISGGIECLPSVDLILNLKSLGADVRAYLDSQAQKFLTSYVITILREFFQELKTLKFLTWII